MDTSPSAATAKHGLRDRRFGKLAILVAVLLLALLVSRSCGSSQPQITQAEAIEVAKGAVDYEPDRVFVRLLRRGVPARSYWGVSLQILDEDGVIERVTVVVVDGVSGEVAEVRIEAP